MSSLQLSAQCQLVPAGGHKPLLLATVVVRLVPEWRQRLPRALLVICSAAALYCCAPGW